MYNIYMPPKKTRVNQVKNSDVDITAFNAIDDLNLNHKPEYQTISLVEVVKDSMQKKAPAHETMSIEAAYNAECIQTKEHKRTGRDMGEMQYKHQDLRDTIGYHLRSLRTMGNGRNDDIDVKVNVDLNGIHFHTSR
jgi:hypothetical protein